MRRPARGPEAVRAAGALGAALLLGLQACVLLGLQACAGSPPQPDRYHRLRVAPPAPRATPLLPGVVEVERLQASDVLRGRALTFARADQPDVLRHAAHHYWVDAPPVLLQQVLLDQLREGGLAGRAVAPERRDRPDWILSGRVQRFERRVSDGASEAAVEVDLALRRHAERRLLLQGRYRASRPAGASVESSVAAMGAAVEEVFAAFFADVEAALAEPAPAPSS